LATRIAKRRVAFALPTDGATKPGFSPVAFPPFRLELFQPELFHDYAELGMVLILSVAIRWTAFRSFRLTHYVHWRGSRSSIPSGWRIIRLQQPIEVATVGKRWTDFHG
jgi:hypothetical protein